MTALAGFWSFDGHPTAPAVERMLSSQAAYGRHSAYETLGPLSLGRRLFRVLPEDVFDPGPIFDRESQQLLVADVRLDNRDELCRDIQLRLGSLSDAAVLMSTLKRWGPQAVERLVGDFAFALWDMRAHQLTLARDFLGERPLHYHQGRHFFAFASMPKGLHALPDVPYAPSGVDLANFIALRPEAVEASFFEDIEKVAPGEIVTISRAGISKRQYWRPPAVERGRRRQDYEEGLRSELDRAVAVRLRGAEKAVASHLSGGLDSSSITATAARLLQAPGKVIAYTAAPPDDYVLPARQNRIWNEWPQACAVAALYGNIEHIRIDSSGKSPVADLDRLFHAFERPYLNLCNGVWATGILADVASRGIPVLLTGAFANASLSWDGLGSLAHLLRSGRILPFTKAAWSLFQNGMPAAAVAARTLKPLMPDRLRSAISELRWGRRKLSDVAAVSLATAIPAERDEIERLSDDPLQQRLQELRYVDLGNYRKGALGGWGVDIRDPAGDRRLVEFCLSIPPEHFLLGGLPRGLARRTFADRLPDMVTGERRYGYQGANWHEGLSAARPQLRKEVDRISRASGSDRIVDVERLKALAEAWPEGGWDTPEIIHNYRHALLRGVSAGHFYRKAKGSNG